MKIRGNLVCGLFYMKPMVILNESECSSLLPCCTLNVGVASHEVFDEVIARTTIMKRLLTRALMSLETPKVAVMALLWQQMIILIGQSLNHIPGNLGSTTQLMVKRMYFM